MNLGIELEALKLPEGRVDPRDGAELTEPIDWGLCGSKADTVETGGLWEQGNQQIPH